MRALQGLFRKLRGWRDERVAPSQAFPFVRLGLALSGLFGGVLPFASAESLDPWYLSAAHRAAQLAEFKSLRARDVIAFQPFRAELRGLAPDGTRLRLISLNPTINTWFVLETQREGQHAWWHLENPMPGAFFVSLGPENDALIIDTPSGRIACRPWEGELARAQTAQLSYAPICDGALVLRTQTSGYRTLRESMTDLLRASVPFGEDIISFVKTTLYRDAFRESARVADSHEAAAAVEALGRAQLEQPVALEPRIGLPLAEGAGGPIEAGAWYALADVPGVYASIVQPGLLARELLNRRDGANPLGGIENGADVYLVAFDLDHFELGYELGTDHPSVGWSPRPDVPRTLPGPDGFASLEPLQMTGMLNPVHRDRIAAVIAGGFKREHAAWRMGTRARTNQGHHYGFVVHGTVLSRLQPGLATVFTLDDGTIDLTVWQEEDNALLPYIRFARQNGVPLVEPGPDGTPQPGDQVMSWMGGNWSGSTEAQLRTLRAGLCLREAEGRRFLIYGVFTAATPSGMARVFQAYGCRHAMQLDMNSLDLTYAAVYAPRPVEGGETFYLDRRMAASDRRDPEGRPLRRFVDMPDSRDFLYLLRR